MTGSIAEGVRQMEQFGRRYYEATNRPDKENALVGAEASVEAMKLPGAQFVQALRDSGDVEEAVFRFMLPWSIT